jgi:hypothetical protein
VVAIIAFALLYYSCKLGGPNPWLHLDMCPPECWSGATPPIDEHTPAPGCPPIDSKLRQTNAPILNAAASACLAGAGTWTETATLISCSSPLNNINCYELGRDPMILKLIYDASQYGAIYRCQNNWVGIWCPGSGAAPYPQMTECGWYFTSGDSQINCGGPCQSGQECVKTGETCSCQDIQQQEPEYTCETLGGGASICALGTCPPGYYCDSTITGQCACMIQSHI